MRSLIDLLLEHGQLFLFLVTFAARAGMPLPAAPLLVIAGGMAAAGSLSWPLALGLATLANVLGDGVWFLAGRRFGHRVMKLLCRISLSPDSCVRQSESLISRWGGRSLLAAKFVPGVSVVAAPMAGALGMSWRRFVAFDLAAGATWSAVFLALGWALRDQIQQTLEVLAGAGLVALLALLAVIALLIAQRAWRRYTFTKDLANKRITPQEVLKLMAQGREPIFIDVRADASRTIDPRRIPGALLAELQTILAHAAGLSRDRLVVLYCNCPNEVSAARAASLLEGAGFKHARALAGGWMGGWRRGGRLWWGDGGMQGPALSARCGELVKTASAKSSAQTTSSHRRIAQRAASNCLRTLRLVAGCATPNDSLGRSRRPATGGRSFPRDSRFALSSCRKRCIGWGEESTATRSQP